MHRKCCLAAGVFLMVGEFFVNPATLDTIGVTALRNEDTTLTGVGIRGAQPEGGAPNWQVNPASVSQPTNLFAWISSSGSSSTFPNALGQESGHAGAVGYNFYGATAGVAPGIVSLDNYEAGHFLNTLVPSLTAIRAQVVNQSFVVGGSLAAVAALESQYDNYVATYNTVIVSGAGNEGPPLPPSTAYNVISVAAFGGLSAIGPTTNGGRAKPDITAPAGVTSYATPLVAGVATVLLQSAARNDAGAATAATATNAQTIKALLLNGAVKPANWTNGPTSPLDARHGAGMVNAYNSWLQLRGGKRAYIESTSSTVGGDHFPTSNPNHVPVLRGWDFNTLSTSVINDDVNHYYFNLDPAQAGRFSLTATLVWLRRLNQTGVNNLDLFLYDTATSNLVASSQSTVDNVEHFFLPNLPAGRYDLQVLKHGGLGAVSMGESYALAFDFQPVKLSLTPVAGQVQLAWPVSASGFTLQTTTSSGLTNGWVTAGGTAVQTNGQNVMRFNPTNNQRHFRLSRP